MTTFSVDIILFPDVELLDFAGPYEVFSTLRLPEFGLPVRVKAWAATDLPITSANGLRVLPDDTFENLKKSNLLIIPGGNGTKKVIGDDAFMSQCAKWIEDCDRLLTVCTGARIPAQLGLLDGLEITTHHSAIDELKSITKNARVRENVRFCDNGKIITAAGVSAGVDASLYITGVIFGKKTAERVRRFIEY